MTLATARKPKSRKVSGYVRAVLALEAVQKRRTERYDRYVQPLDVKRNAFDRGRGDSRTRAERRAVRAGPAHPS